jgi:DNA modification methylase
MSAVQSALFQSEHDATLLTGDCLDVLRTLPADSVDSIVTDPPYGLAFMGKRWDYDVPSVEIWAECLRVLKPGGHLLAFAGTRTQHRMAVRIEDAGFEIRDMIAWVYGSGFPKSLNLDGEHKGWGTALKPALEPITVARKPLIGTVAENVLAHGTGALNVDGCRVEGRERTDYGLTNSTRSAGNTYGKPSVSANFDANQGRWPANLIHDGSEEVVGLFPVTHDRGNYTPGKWAKQDVWQGPNQPIEDGTSRGPGGSTARFFYCAKASKRDRDEGCDKLQARSAGECVDRVEGSAGMESPRAGAGRTSGSRNHHPTVKPTALMQYLCRLVTPPGGTVLDPFMGSGSTGKAAMLEGFRFIGIERDPEYVKIAEARIGAAV